MVLPESAKEKLGRADELAAELVRSVTDWTSAAKLNLHHEWRDQRHGYRLILAPWDESPSVSRWRVLIGDCAHNLRAALDNLMWALAVDHHDPPRKPTSIRFPICAVAPDCFDKWLQQCAPQINDEAAALVARLQPFQRQDPAQDALLLLRDLNNIDKHRVPVTIRLAPAVLSHAGEVEFETDEDAAANVPPDQTVWAGPLEPGIVLLEHRTTSRVVKIKGRWDLKATVSLETRQGPQPLGLTAEKLCFYTRLVAHQFSPFFGDADSAEPNTAPAG